MKKQENSNVARNAAIGFVGGVSSAIVGEPFNRAIDPLTSGNYDTYVAAKIGKGQVPKTRLQYAKWNIRKIFTGEGSTLLGLKTIKHGVGWAAAIGTTTGIKHMLDKRASSNYPNLNKDLKINPKIRHKVQKTTPTSKPLTPTMKKTVSRWTPLSSEARFTWSNLDSSAKRSLNSLTKQFSKKVQNHNKNFMIYQAGKGNSIEKINKKTTRFLTRRGKNAPLY